MRSNTARAASVARRPRNRGDPHQTVVWVRGEQDISTRDRLSVRLAEAAGRNGADVVVDLGGVTFMDASTIGALVAARNILGVQSRSLTFRHPSPPAQRLLDLCGLAPLTDDLAPQPRCPTALGTWVSAPARDQTTAALRPMVAQEAPALEPADVTAGGSVTTTASTPHRRALP